MGETKTEQNIIVYYIYYNLPNATSFEHSFSMVDIFENCVDKRLIIHLIDSIVGALFRFGMERRRSRLFS